MAGRYAIDLGPRRENETEIVPVTCKRPSGRAITALPDATLPALYDPAFCRASLEFWVLPTDTWGLPTAGRRHGH